MTIVRTGLDVLRDRDWQPLRGRRVGLSATPRRSIRSSATPPTCSRPRPGVELAALFGPEHGFHGDAQDLIGVGDATAGALRVHSLYGDTFESCGRPPSNFAGSTRW